MKINRVVLSAAGLLLLSTDLVPGMDGQVAGMFKSKEGKPKCEWAHGVQHTVGEQNINEEWQGKTAAHLYSGGWNVSADFIYWRADEDNLEYVADMHLATDETRYHSKVKQPSIKWSPGFRLGIGYTFEKQDGWDLRLQWTRFETHQTGHEKIDQTLEDGNFHLLQPWWNPSFVGELATQASVDWKLHYNVIDLELGRDYFISRKITLRPYFGLRGAIINQQYDAGYEAIFFFRDPSEFIIPTSVKAENNFRGIGARAGGDFLWHFTKQWSVTGKCSGSLSYGKFDIDGTMHHPVRINQQTRTFTSQVAKLQQELSKVIPNVEVGIGLMWETYFNQNRNHIALSIGYEFSEWFSQNQLTEVDEFDNPNKGIVSGPTYNHFNGDLGLQGATFTARFDF
jgi:hypothetical protein